MDKGRESSAVFVRLLGRPEVRWPGGSDDLLSGMPQRMLAYLAARGGDVTRDEVASHLWPHHELERRRGNLRRLLGRARALPYAGDLDGDRERLRWPVATDLALIRAGDGGAEARAALLSSPLLDGLELDEDDALAAWLRQERERLRLLRRHLLIEHAAERQASGDTAAAATTLERLVDEDPLDEEALQRLLQTAVDADAATRARSAYRRFVLELHRELGLAPLEATHALAAALNVDDAPEPTAHREARPTPLVDHRHDAAGTRQPPSVALPPLDGAIIGRSRALADIRAARAPLLVVSGAPGVGKTATVRAATDGAPSLWLRAQEATSRHPFAAIEAALRRELDGPASSAIDRMPPSERATLARLVPTAAVGASAPQRIVDPDEGRGRLVTAAAHALEQAAGPGGVIVVDDLPQLDAASLDVVATIARHAAAGAAPLRVIATARTDELAAGLGRGTLLRLEAEGLVESLTLDPWTEQDLHAFLVAASGGSGGRLFARRVHAATGGNPLFVHEALRHLFTVGLLWVEPGGGWSTPFDDATDDYTELPLPESVRDAVRERVARLDGGTRRLLEAAALAVPPFTLSRVAPATALSEWLALEALERAVASGLLVPSGDGYRFGHELIRTAVADGLASERAALVERRLAWALERDRGSPSLIAAHFERAGRREEAYRWHRRAAEEAAQLYVPGVAVEHLERAAELAGHDRARVDTLLEWAELLDRTVDPRARQSVLERARDAAERLGDPGPRTRVAIARIRTAVDLGDIDAAMSIGAEASPLARASGSVAELHLALARVHLKRGDHAAALAELESGFVELAPGPSALRGLYHLEGYVNCSHLSGDLPGAFRHIDAALDVFNAIGHRELVAEALNFHGIFLAFDGRHDEGIARLEEGLAIAREVGHVAVQRRALLNLVKLHTDRADAEAAAPLVTEGLALAHDFEGRTTEVAFLLADGYVRYLRGELGSAARAFDRAITVADTAGNPMWCVHARLIAATPLLLAGHHAVAGELLAAGQDIVEAHALAYLQARVDSRLAALALAQGEARRALDILAPWTTRGDVPPEEAGEHACTRAAAHALLGDPSASLEAAEACSRAPTLEVVVAGEALTLEATLALGRDARAATETVRARLDDGRAPPFETLALLRALARAHRSTGDDQTADTLLREARDREARLRASITVEPVR